MASKHDIDLRHIGRGFENPVLDTQAVFKGAMWALSRPGLRRDVRAVQECPKGLSSSIVSLLLTLADFETPVWLPPEIAMGDAGHYIRFYCGAPLVADPGLSLFAVVPADEAGGVLGRLAHGEDRFPDRSATLLIDVPALSGGASVSLSGPGVDGKVMIAPQGLTPQFWHQATANHALYPLGVDFFICAGIEVIGLPRSTVLTPVDED